MSSLKYIANAQLMTASLGSTYTTGSGTMTLSSGEGAYLPSTGDFWIRQANVLASTAINILKVTARAGDVLTVVGGQDGTTDQDIQAGTSLCWSLSYSALTQLIADIQAQVAASGSPLAVYAPAPQTAAVTTTPLLASVVAGLYEVAVYVQVDSASALPVALTVNVGYTSNGVGKSITAIPSLNLLTPNGSEYGDVVLSADGGSTITFEILAAGGTYSYLPYIVLYRLG